MGMLPIFTANTSPQLTKPFSAPGFFMARDLLTIQSLTVESMEAGCEIKSSACGDVAPVRRIVSRATGNC
jgi:hypothetical protein